MGYFFFIFCQYSGVLPSPVTYFEGVQYDNKTNAGRSHEARFGYIPSSFNGAPSGMGVSIIHIIKKVS